MAATKFSVAALPSRYVPRPRLHGLLDAGAQLPLTVVVGVPGAGKSVMLRSWLHDRPAQRSIWLTCDGRDTDPVTFWTALTTALSQAWPDRWLDVVELLSEREADLEDVAIAVVNHLADLGEPVVLVIDDFHFAATAAAPSLIMLIERLPPGCRVVVGSRTEPQLALHRFRAHGQLLEVRDAELRLTASEVAAVMREFGVELTEAETEAIAGSTEGWMAGVQMAAVSLSEEPDRERFLANLAKTPRAITDFLITEALDRQPIDIREFLLATSVLDVLDEASCAAVTQCPGAAALLGHVEERNLFLIDLGQGAYRYHRLFGDLLRHRLRAEGPEREPVLHGRAAAHYLKTGDPETAIAHLLAADEAATAFSVLGSNLVAGFYQGDGRMLRRLVDKLVERGPTTLEAARLPDIALALAAAGPAGAAEPWVARTRRHAGDLDDSGRARLAVATALLALRYGDASGIEAAFSDYRGPEGLPDEEAAYCLPTFLARSRLWLGDVQGARQLFEQALAGLDDMTPQHVVTTSG
ncbi:MAG TPA: AAA family ATPase, partial [Acidimicrobiales bacterium]|nr:AAA family ATPase [Acidimicrobiales bacterium]